MKKKLYFIAIAFLGVMGISNAQTDEECRRNLSLYGQDAHPNVKNYDAAYEPWKQVFENCPGMHSGNYTYGELILKHKIKNSSGAEKEGYVKMLMGLYDTWSTHFPAKTSLAKTIIKKVMFQYDEKTISKEDIYSQLHKAFTEDKEHFQHSKALYLYFSSLVDLHKAGKQDLQTVFDAYDDVTEKIEVENRKLTDKIAKLLPKEDAGTLTSREKRSLKINRNNSGNYGKIAGSVDTKLGKLADCENLIPLYQKSFDAKQNDLQWVKRAVGRMYAKDCIDDPMFRKLFEKQLAMEPSASAYLYSAALKLKSGDSNGALKDFTKASELETDTYKKSNILYQIAVRYRRISKSTSRTYARKALDVNPSNGKAYLLIAGLVASSANQCGTTSFEKRATYWKAANIAAKAGRVDPSLKGKSAQAVRSYTAKAPSKSDIFSNNMQGKTITFKCWVGGSVKVPNL